MLILIKPYITYTDNLIIFIRLLFKVVNKFFHGQWIKSSKKNSDFYLFNIHL